jgi:hypothetical protein
VTRFYRRTTPGLRENLAAGLVAAGLAAGVAAVSFYLVRLFLAREPLDPRSPGLPGSAAELPPAGEAGTGEREGRG